MLDAVTIDRFYTTYLPPENAPELAPFHPDNNLPKAARNALLCLQIYTEALQSHPDRIKQFELVPGTETISLQLTPDLKMDILCGEPACTGGRRRSMMRPSTESGTVMNWCAGPNP